MTLSRLITIWRHRTRSIFRKEQVDADLHQEIAFHFEQLVDEFAVEGLPPAEAARAARRALGSIPLLEEEARDVRRVTWLHDSWHDLLFSLRLMRKNRGFTIVATLSLALGIGANTAVLGVMSDLQQHGLRFPAADRLVVVRTFPLDNPQRLSNASVPDYFAWKTRSHAFAAIGASLVEQRDLGADEEGASAVRMAGQGVTPSVFQALGVQPALGRLFSEDEAQVGRRAPVIVISDRFWRQYFGGSRAVINTHLRLNGEDITVIGVMPPEFRYPLDNVDYWAPLALNELQREGSARFFGVTARLKPGVTLAQAQAELTAISAQAAADFPDRRKWGARVLSMQEALLGWTRQPLLTFEAAVLLVLLIACANVAGLLVARGSVRRSEIAVRMALGAGRGRIMRQFLIEGVLLSVVGGAVGVLVAVLGLRGLILMIPPPAGLRMGAVGFNATMVATIAALSVGAGMSFACAPALAVFRFNLAGSLNESVRGTGTHSGGQRLRGALVVAQIAFALVLLTGTGLLVKSSVRLAGRELNFEPQRILSFEVRVPVDDLSQLAGMFFDTPYGIARPPVAIMQRLYEELRGIPGAESVAGISSPPVNSLIVPTQVVHVEGRPRPLTDAERAAAAAKYFLVTPGFFAMVKARLNRGRELDARDTATSPWTAMVNETAARRFWPGEDPIGKRFTFDIVSGERPREVVGVIRDIPVRAGFFDGDAVVYASYLQQPAEYRGPSANLFGQMTFLLRHQGDPMSLLPAARRAVARVDPNRALGRVMPLDWYIIGGLRDRSAYALVLALFALVAVLLAAIGLYGVMAYTVAQRTREIGVHLALGASARRVIVLVGRSVVLIIAAGFALGIAGSLAFARFIESQLWGVTETDPATYAAVCGLLLLVVVVACSGPLRRALRVDPTVALRYE